MKGKCLLALLCLTVFLIASVLSYDKYGSSGSGNYAAGHYQTRYGGSRRRYGGNRPRGGYGGGRRARAGRRGYRARSRGGRGGRKRAQRAPTHTHPAPVRPAPATRPPVAPSPPVHHQAPHGGHRTQGYYPGGGSLVGGLLGGLNLGNFFNRGVLNALILSKLGALGGVGKGVDVVE